MRYIKEVLMFFFCILLLAISVFAEENFTDPLAAYYNEITKSYNLTENNETIQNISQTINNSTIDNSSKENLDLTPLNSKTNSIGKKNKNQTNKTIKLASLCDGCIIGGKCIKKGVQRIDPSDSVLYYCDFYNTVNIAKGLGDLCNSDYECKSFSCSNGFCSELKPAGEDTDSTYNFSILLALIAFFLIAGIISVRFYLQNKQKKEEKEKLEKQKKKKKDFIDDFGNIKQSPYKYRPEFDVLEKELKTKLKKKPFN